MQRRMRRYARCCVKSLAVRRDRIGHPVRRRRSGRRAKGKLQPAAHEMRCWWNQSLLRYLLAGLPVRAQGLAFSGEPALDATCN
jgi:hypothetical protein